ncbi:asparagine--tRNA ligase, cytoplasmic 2-like [Neltuma alba]|uniref:asparagine--tRNA ligase, cytoplasmic 2-like n=1 Tax=Neltuma alba TaxID=207710 RepID=UPI0010A38149|nr:asparagine--tRNA ligase, cytoplasmic 2-like [Prosopis alba]
MASQYPTVPSPAADATTLTPFKYSNRVLLKTLLERADQRPELIGQRVVIGGWVKSSQEVKKSSPITSSLHGDKKADESKTKDVTCVEIIQSKIPLIRSILEAFGGSGGCKKNESVTPKPTPPQPSTVYLMVTDGSSVASLQVVVDSSLAPPSKLRPTGTCILVEGFLKKPSAKGKRVIELEADRILHIGTVDPDKYPLSKKRLPLDMLRGFSHFRPRTTTVASVMRIRSAVSFATHSFFEHHAFFDVQVPIITTSNYEGFGKMFSVISLEQKADKEKLNTIDEIEGINLETVKAAVREKSNLVENLKRSDSNREALVAAVQDLNKTNELASQLEARGKMKSASSFKADKIDSSEEFFSCQTYLTASGGLHLETYACALGNVYSFGPRFQADKTDSSKQAAEMWMVEAEMAFAQLEDSMRCAMDLLKYLCKWVCENCSEDMNFVAKRIDNACVSRLQQTVSGPSEIVSYRDVIDILRKVTDKNFETNIQWGVSLTTEHLSYLADNVFKKPVMIYNYPKEAKPFFLRVNDDMRTVAAFDLVVPKVGVIVSGSQNEERLDMIISRIKELGLPREKYEWYLDLRRHGTVKHSGFTLRFDLLILFITGLTNVRDVIPFPRSHGKIMN